MLKYLHLLLSLIFLTGEIYMTICYASQIHLRYNYNLVMEYGGGEEIRINITIE